MRFDNDIIKIFSFWVLEKEVYQVNNYYFFLCIPAVGAGLAGGKMARRTGNLEEFEFKGIAKNQNQGVSSITPPLWSEGT